MKKTKFFALAGLVTLAVVSVFGTKPTRKFAAVTSIHAGGADLFHNGVSASLTTSGSGHTAFFKTVGSGAAVVTLRTSAGGTKIQFN
jgi:hypothetical protein